MFFGSTTAAAYQPQQQLARKASSSSSSTVRILVHGGDNMLGRAVQLSFPIQAPGEEFIKDSCTARHYWDLCWNHPSDHSSAENTIDDVRQRNANEGSYLWGDYQGMIIAPPPDLRLLNLETAVTRSIHNSDIPYQKGINYHLHMDNYETILRGFLKETHQGKDTTTTAPGAGPSPVIVNCANNHGMDYGRQALEEETLPLFAHLNEKYSINKAEGLSFQSIGLGWNVHDVMKPAVVALASHPSPTTSELDTGSEQPRHCSSNSSAVEDDTHDKVKVKIFAFSSGCSGTPMDWWATDTRSGLLGLPGIYTPRDVDAAMEIVKRVIPCKRDSDKDTSTAGRKEDKDATNATGDDASIPELRIVSIHWGPNWAGKGEKDQQLSARREFAHRLIDECGVDFIYGHSSHHARGMEIYKDSKLILYGAGDIINDYEGFENAGEEQYNRLGGIYVIDFDLVAEDQTDANPTVRFRELRIVPMFMDRLRLRRATTSSAIWRPQLHRLERNLFKIRDFGLFVNKMSDIDAGARVRNDGGGVPLTLEYVVSDPQIPGGPILRSKT